MFLAPSLSLLFSSLTLPWEWGDSTGLLDDREVGGGSCPPSMGRRWCERTETVLVEEEVAPCQEDLLGALHKPLPLPVPGLAAGPVLKWTGRALSHLRVSEGQSPG